MLYRQLILVLTLIIFLCSMGATIATYYASSFYRDKVPKNDLQPSRIALLVGLFSIAVAAAIFVANRMVKRIAMAASEAIRGTFHEENEAMDLPCTCLLSMQIVTFIFTVTWLCESTKTMYESLESFSVKDDYKIFRVVAHSINTLASIAFGILCGFAFRDAQEAYLVNFANMPHAVHPVSNEVAQGHADPNMNDVQRAYPARQQIELQDLNPVEAPLQSQNLE